MKKALWLLSLTFVAGSLCATPAGAQTSTAELKAGDEAPGFTLPGTDGKTYSLKDLRGHWVVLGWFPKAFTAG
jgi:cytochrome oxidase Cu insertion factor (SCO1/SenC/PrrC family)